MKILPLVVATVLATMMIGQADALAKPPETWDGLSRVQTKRFDLAYLQPGATLNGYNKVMLDPTEVAFAKNWQRDYNSSGRSLAARISDRDVKDAIAKAMAASDALLANAWKNGGYIIVTDPGPDVLRIKTGVVNVQVNAPDVQAAGQRSFAPEAGQATFFVEVRDSLTGALIGRAVDQAYAGDIGPSLRTAGSNRADFRDLVERWGKDTVRAVNELKALATPED